MVEKIKDTLFVIPARGGSKGLPKKNILKLNGKSLICYTIDAARGVVGDENICVSTNDEEIAEVVEKYGLKVPFVRPSELSTDTTNTWDVVKHAILHYENMGRKFSRICLLQPTSPLRGSKHIHEVFDLWGDNIDMIVSVKKSKSAALICGENNKGFLHFTLNPGGKRRQDISDYYEYNGAIYLINEMSLEQKNVSSFQRIKKYVMSEMESVDIDSKLDFQIVESIMRSIT